jgi:hypothetical protein
LHAIGHEAERKLWCRTDAYSIDCGTVQKLSYSRDCGAVQMLIVETVVLYRGSTQIFVCNPTTHACMPHTAKMAEANERYSH